MEPPRDIVPLITTPNETEAGIVRSVLTDAGIESWQHTADGAALGVFGAAGLNPSTVTVRREDTERAREALERNREDSVDIDWEEVDVGEPADELAARIAREPGAAKREYRFSTDPALVLFGAIAAIGVLTGLYVFAFVVLALTGVYVLRRLMVRRKARRHEGTEARRGENAE